MAKIKKGDQVIVIAGKEKGKQGTVLSVSTDRVGYQVIEGVKTRVFKSNGESVAVAK